jgi:Fe-S cluster biogenesis protein NfuA/nitrite reductase/ring-hydroxylating ferredoxin subunit
MLEEQSRRHELPVRLRLFFNSFPRLGGRKGWGRNVSTARNLLMPQEKNLRAAGDRIESLLQELGGVADPRVRANAEELVRLLMELYGSALARILKIVDDTGPAVEIYDRLAADDLVASLLVLHGLHPLNVETRIARALDRVRPYLGSHGGDVKLLGVQEGVVHLRLEGSCHGCPSSTVTMKLAIEKAIEEAAPEVIRIEVEGASPTVSPASFGNGASAKSSQTAPQNPEASSGQWIVLDKLPEINGGNLALTKLAGMSILVCRVGEKFYAYQNFCSSCASALGGSALQENILTCSACARRYDVCRAGQCLDMSELHLAPLPLLVEHDGVKIALATEG